MTTPHFGRPDTEMTAIGVAYVLGLVMVLVALVPFLAIVWLTGEVIDRATGGT